MNIKIIITSIALLFSISAGAATVESLINTHGKRAIMDIIADKIHKKFTINVDGEIRQAHAPSEEYITTGTLATDIARAGMTPNSVETAFTERSAQARIQADQKAEEHRRRLELAEKLLQKTMERREEDAKILAGASESEREQFRIAQANGARIEALRARRAQSQRAYRSQAPAQRQAVAGQIAGNNPICAIDKDKVSTDLKNEYANRYPDSYGTQEMLHNAGMKDYDYLCGLTMGNVEIGVVNKLLSRYYPSMSTIKMLFGHNMESYRKLHQ